MIQFIENVSEHKTYVFADFQSINYVLTIKYPMFMIHVLKHFKFIKLYQKHVKSKILNKFVRTFSFIIFIFYDSFKKFHKIKNIYHIYIYVNKINVSISIQINHYVQKEIFRKKEVMLNNL